MARILVLTVDRDNDLGIKTSIRGPVVGRRQVLTAALKLGIADPEKAIPTRFLALFPNTINFLRTGRMKTRSRLPFLQAMRRLAFAPTEPSLLS